MLNQQLQLEHKSRVGVIGGGPAGSFVSIFLLDLAVRMGIELRVDIYEPRDFSSSGPIGCNMCGGIISESLVQILAAEGINLPATVVQRGIDSYMLHTDVGSTRIDTPLQEMRIGAVHRGSGPRDAKDFPWESFDGYLQNLALSRGADLHHNRVDKVSWENGKPQILIRNQPPVEYDLVITATGVNVPSDRIFKNAELQYTPPETTKTYIREYYLGTEKIEKAFGTSMHVFLLDIPRLEFAAVVPKGDYVSLCLLGEDIDKELLNEFLHTPVVKNLFPAELDLDQPSCWCSPKINVDGAKHPYGDRILFIGDCGVTRLYKDGIGAAYRMAKAAASAAIFQGISEIGFEKHFLPACNSIETDNSIGKFIFLFTRLIQKWGFAKRAVLNMVRREQALPAGKRHMSTVLWDVFTGSESYREILVRTLHPGFWGRFAILLVAALFSRQDLGKSINNKGGI